MNCEKFENLLVAYMDGRATEADRRDVELHLVACSACRTRTEEFGRMWSALDEAPAPQVSPAFEARLRAHIAAEPQRTWLAWFPAPRFAFSAALLLMLSVWVGNRPAIDVPLETVAVEDDSRSSRDLQVLEDLDVLVNFEALSELPSIKPSKL